MRKANSRDYPNPLEPITFTITALEFAHHFPDVGEHPWRALKRAAKQLRGRYVKYPPKANKELDVNWFDSIEYSNGDGEITIRFSYSIHCRLAGMDEQFTKFPLLEVRQLRSVYGMRLFEIVYQFQSRGYRRVTTEEYRFMMDCVDKYKSVGELKRNTLLPAIKDLKNNSNLNIKVKEFRERRKITHFEFVIVSQ
jgi:plasmid replication initiation protein